MSWFGIRLFFSYRPKHPHRPCARHIGKKVVSYGIPAKAYPALVHNSTDERKGGQVNRGIPQPQRGEDMPRKSLDALGVTPRLWLVVRGAFPLTACHVANEQTPLRGVR